MRENGMIDGNFLKRTIEVWKPQISKYISIPDRDFCLSEFVEDSLNLITGRIIK